MLNLEGRRPVDGLDDKYATYIRRANLDAMGGRAKFTLEAHVVVVSQSVRNCRLIRKTATIPHQGPMPLADNVGMGLAVELLQHSLTAKPRLKGEVFIQFDLMRRPQGTYTSV